MKRADAGSWFDPKFAGERVPTLREVLELTKGQVINVVEIKQRGIADRVIKTIEDAKSESQVVLISFHESALKDALEINPRIPRSLLIGGRIPVKRPASIMDLIHQAAEVGGGLDLASKTITPQLVREAHRRGVAVWAWTVDDEDEMRELAAMDVDAITSNYPEKLNSAL